MTKIIQNNKFQKGILLNKLQTNSYFKNQQKDTNSDILIYLIPYLIQYYKPLIISEITSIFKYASYKNKKILYKDIIDTTLINKKRNKRSIGIKKNIYKKVYLNKYYLNCFIYLYLKQQFLKKKKLIQELNNIYLLTKKNKFKIQYYKELQEYETLKKYIQNPNSNIYNKILLNLVLLKKSKNFNNFIINKQINLKKFFKEKLLELLPKYWILYKNQNTEKTLYFKKLRFRIKLGNYYKKIYSWKFRNFPYIYKAALSFGKTEPLFLNQRLLVHPMPSFAFLYRFLSRINLTKYQYNKFNKFIKKAKYYHAAYTFNRGVAFYFIKGNRREATRKIKLPIKYTKKLPSFFIKKTSLTGLFYTKSHTYIKSYKYKGMYINPRSKIYVLRKVKDVKKKQISPNILNHLNFFLSKKIHLLKDVLVIFIYLFKNKKFKMNHTKNISNFIHKSKKKFKNILNYGIVDSKNIVFGIYKVYPMWKFFSTKLHINMQFVTFKDIFKTKQKLLQSPWYRISHYSRKKWSIQFKRISLVKKAIFGSYLYNKVNVFNALRSIYGIGNRRAKAICYNFKLNPKLYILKLTKYKIHFIFKQTKENFVIQESLREFVRSNIKHLIIIRCYKGWRHLRGLPVNGQRTHTNARKRIIIS